MDGGKQKASRRENKYDALRDEGETSKLKATSQNQMGLENNEHDIEGAKSTEKRNLSTTVIIGESMTKKLDGKRIERSAKSKYTRIHIESFKGADSEAMTHYVKPSLRKQIDKMIIHVGTNDFTTKSPNEIVDKIVDICEDISVNHPSAAIIISEIIRRNDRTDFNKKKLKANNLLSIFCRQRNWGLIKQNNIDSKHLNPYGLHQNRTGTAIARLNIRSLIKHIDELRIYLTYKPFDVISINETMLDSSV